MQIDDTGTMVFSSEAERIKFLAVQFRNKKTKSKYHNIKAKIDGITFDSKKEAKRYYELKLLEISGQITGLKAHLKFPIKVDGMMVCTYIADFVYYVNFKDVGHIPEQIVEDVKSKPTKRLPVYRLKKKLMKAVFGIDIKEI